MFVIFDEETNEYFAGTTKEGYEVFSEDYPAEYATEDEASKAIALYGLEGVIIIEENRK